MVTRAFQPLGTDFVSLSLMWIGNGDKVVSVTVRIAVTQLVAGGK